MLYKVTFQPLFLVSLHNPYELWKTLYKCYQMKRPHNILNLLNKHIPRSSISILVLLYLALLYPRGESQATSNSDLVGNCKDASVCGKKSRRQVLLCISSEKKQLLEAGNPELVYLFNRYFLYDVNPGEGFNLRRDIYIRVAPLVKTLNRIDSEHEWVLVSTRNHGKTRTVRIIHNWGNLTHTGFAPLGKSSTLEKNQPWYVFPLEWVFPGWENSRIHSCHWN